MQVKDKQGNVLREMTIRRCAIYLPKLKRKRYWLKVKNAINNFLMNNEAR